MSEAMIQLLMKGTWETMVMTFLSGLFGFILGLPTGVMLFLTREGQLMENKWTNRILSVFVNIHKALCADDTTFR